MFSLLNPISLWLGALIAVPLVIHFLGRQKLDKRPFPSLLLVREKLARSMHRHRLKNLLLLLIRTLLILCLLLALSNPVLESLKAIPGAAAPAGPSVALIHNGIYGALRSGQEGSGDLLELQRLRLRARDSADGLRTLSIPIIADGPGAREVSERFGDYGEAVGRLVSSLGDRPGTALAQIPVFAWTDLAPAKGSLLRALAANPGLRIDLSEFGQAAPKVNAFASLKSSASPEAPTVKLQARLNPAAETDPARIEVTLNGRFFQEVASEDGRVEVTLPLGDAPRTSGKLSFPGEAFAVRDLHFCFPEAGGWMLAHAGSSLASLPSLGRETYFRRILHVASARDIPWNGIATGSRIQGGSRRAAGEGAAVGTGRPAPGKPRLVYLSGERGVPADAYARAVEFVKHGGSLIIGAGRESDVPMLNRFLLQPLRLGRLGNLVENAGTIPVKTDAQAMAGLGRLPRDPGAVTGAVRKRFAFAPDSGVDVLLSQGGRGEAVLAARTFHRGHVLLWTTDIDDLEWSDLGVAPFTPLLHQAFQEAGSRERAANATVASDSVHTAPIDPGAGGSGIGMEVRDPEGRIFTKVRADGSRLRIGPFDKLGIHRVIAGKDTQDFAVNLSRTGPAGIPASLEEWESRDRIAKTEFLQGFEAYRGRLRILDQGASPAAQASSRSLWPMLFLAAILLLLLEGLISSKFSLRRNRP